MAKRNPMLKKLDPIPEEERSEWNSIIEETKELVALSDKTSFELILIAAKINGKWGDKKIDRWAEECEIPRSSAYLYKRFARNGFDEAFMEKWGHLGFTKLLYIMQRHATLRGPHVAEWLQWASDHPQVPSEALDSYMMNNIAPPAHLADEKKAEIRAAIQQKQIREKFSPEVGKILEDAIETHPHLADKIMNYRITPEQDVEKVEQALGIKDADDNAAAAEAKRVFDNVKKMSRWFMQNEKDIIRIIGGFTEYPDLIQGEFFRIARIVDNIIKAEKSPVPTFDAEIIEMNIGKKASNDK